NHLDVVEGEVVAAQSRRAQSLEGDGNQIAPSKQFRLKIGKASWAIHYAIQYDRLAEGRASRLGSGDQHLHRRFGHEIPGASLCEIRGAERKRTSANAREGQEIRPEKVV